MKTTKKLQQLRKMMRRMRKALVLGITVIVIESIGCPGSLGLGQCLNNCSLPESVSATTAYFSSLQQKMCIHLDTGLDMRVG